MPAIIGELVAKITGNTTSFDKAIERSGTSLKQFEDKLKRTGNQAREFGQRLSIIASAPILGVFITSLNKLKSSSDPAAQTLKDMDKTIGELQINIAKALLPVIEIAANAIKDFNKWFSGLDEGTKKTIVTIGLLIAVIGPLIAVIGTFMSLGVVGVIIAIAAAVIGLSVAVANAVTQQTEYNKTFEKGSEQIVTYRKSLKELKDETKKFQDKISEFDMSQLRKELTAVNYDINGQIKVLKALQEEDKKLGIVGDSYKTIKAQNQLNVLYIKQKEILDALTVKNKELKDQEDAAKKAREEKNAAIMKSIEEGSKEQKNISDYLAQVEQSIADADAKAVEKTKQALEERKQAYKDFADQTFSLVSPVFESLGAAITSTGEDSAKAWENVKKSALSAIASVVEGFAKQWALEGAALLLNPFTAGQAIGLFAASAAALVGAGIIRNLKEGGLIMPTPGGSIVRIAEAGVPEYAVPERKDYLTRLADRITDNMSNMRIQNNIDNRFAPQMSIKINERELFRVITEASRDGRITIDPNRGIAKR